MRNANSYNNYHIKKHDNNTVININITVKRKMVMCIKRIIIKKYNDNEPENKFDKLITKILMVTK